ncbi:hexosaminidase D [Leptinotarsa decemlineata]|uniref:hexosaminidase D n=1 Tax=Leptinotarsa decemlineata TaxID=7539 RepID=UPI000C255894|nr:hexosaminidase D-like [Leptinotarsa decemlineata]
MVKKQYHNRVGICFKPMQVYCTLMIATLVGMTLLHFFWKNADDIKTVHEQTELSQKTLAQNHADPRKSTFQGEKIVHLDLKGAPPKITYYHKLFPLLAKLGASGILIEYEDMFPYMGELENITALNSYTLEDIAIINKLAQDNNLRIIPLIPTFGHLEFILKLSEYKDYREVMAYPQVICPIHRDTLKLIKNMVIQIVKSHPNIDSIHIGADEVYYLGICSGCTEYMSKNNISKNALFLMHVKNVVDMINTLFPKLKILMWDDQFRSLSEKEMKMINFDIEPVVWKYTKDVYDELGPSLWGSYKKVFSKIWTASAFKGATASNAFVSKVTHYLQNHRSWMSVMEEFKHQLNFQGIIITGWQRYDHFAVLCELLPVGIPTLAMSLRLLQGYDDSPLSPPMEVAKILQCEQPYGLIGLFFGSPKCSFPGGDILEYVLHLEQLIQEYDIIMEDSRVKGWMNDYSVAHVYSSPSYVDSATSSLSRMKTDLEQIDSGITIAMADVYDEYTINEWKETYIKPLKRKIKKIWDIRKLLLERDTWPRRPLKHDEN